MITVLIFIAVLAVIVLVHEFGHFAVARKLGVAVEEFGVGFPPSIAAIKSQKTAYSLNWIPIGGFVKIKGEQGDHPDDSDSFGYQKIWRRALIIVAGVLMNIVLAFILFSAAYIIGAPSALDSNPQGTAHVSDRSLQIVSVTDPSPAFSAGFMIGDIIKTLDGTPVDSILRFRQLVQPHVSNELAITVSRNDQDIELNVAPEADTDGLGIIGVGLVEVGTVRYPFFRAIWEGAKTTVSLLGQIVTAFYSLLRDLFAARDVAIDVAGPVGIAVLTGQVARLGFVYLLQFAALLSLNLAIINLIPFPALDGGRLLFLGIEKIRRKPVSKKVESSIHTVGFALLMVLVVIVTIKDVSRFSESISSFFQNIF